MERNFLKIKRKFVLNIFKDILLLMAITSIILTIFLFFCLISEFSPFFHIIHIIIAVIIMLSGTLVLIYEWIRSVWKRSMIEVENE